MNIPFRLINYDKIDAQSFKAYDLRVFASLLALQDEQPSSVWSNLIDKTMTILRNSEKESLDLFNSKKEIPELWAMKCVFNLLTPELESGANHFYRGELTFRGLEFFKIYRFLLDKLVKNGTITQEWADNDSRILNQNIDHVG